MSAANRVPAAVPSVRHNSRPCSRSVAANQIVPANTAKSLALNSTVPSGREASPAGVEGRVCFPSAFSRPTSSCAWAGAAVASAINAGSWRTPQPPAPLGLAQ